MKHTNLGSIEKEKKTTRAYKRIFTISVFIDLHDKDVTVAMSHMWRNLFIEGSISEGEGEDEGVVAKLATRPQL